jgi:hypothetical protein
VTYANAAKDYGAMQDAIAALPDVEMIHSVKAPDLGPDNAPKVRLSVCVSSPCLPVSPSLSLSLSSVPNDAPKVCQFRRVAKDVKDDWCDIMRLLDTANDERFLSEVGPDKGFFSDLVRPGHFHPKCALSVLCDSWRCV